MVLSRWAPNERITSTKLNEVIDSLNGAVAFNSLVVGPGAFTPTGVYSDDAGAFPATSPNTVLFVESGTASVPVNHYQAAFIAQKWSSHVGPAGWNTTALITIQKLANGVNSHANALTAQASDSYSQDSSQYLEGMRAQATLLAGTLNAAATGITAVAEISPPTAGPTAGPHPSYLTAVEGTVVWSGTNGLGNAASPRTSFLNPTQGFVASFVADTGTGALGGTSATRADVAFLINPFAIGAYNYGFFAPEQDLSYDGAPDPGAMVKYAVFKASCQSEFGIDLESGAWSTSAIGIGKNTPITGLKNAGTRVALLRITAADDVELGDTGGGTPLSLRGQALTGSAPGAATAYIAIKVNGTSYKLALSP